MFYDESVSIQESQILAAWCSAEYANWLSKNPGVTLEQREEEFCAIVDGSRYLLDNIRKRLG